MNGGKQVETVRKRERQAVLGIIFLALFVYVFLAAPAPEQILIREVEVNAAALRLASAMGDGEAVNLPVLAFCPLKTQLASWIAGERIEPTSLLIQHERMEIRLVPQSDGMILRGELRWRTRGGLLGKAVDSLLARSTRVQALEDTLHRLESAAEGSRIERAALVQGAGL